MQNLPIEVFVARDYSQGIEPVCFARAIPRELEGRVTEHEFLTLIDTVNEHFKEAERVGWNTVLESLAGCLSCYAVFLCYKSKWAARAGVAIPDVSLAGTYKRAMERLETFLRVQNATVFLPAGVRVRNPLFNGN